MGHGKDTRESGSGPAEKGLALGEVNLQGFKYFRMISGLLERLHNPDDDRRRELGFEQYVSLILFKYFNPILTGLRSIQQATELPEVQRKLGVSRTSLGVLSAAARVFDADLLRGVLDELIPQVQALRGDARLGEVGKILTAVDGSWLKALPRMAWALWQDEDHRAVKAHVHFEVLKGVPVHADITNGQTSEKKTLLSNLEAGRLYVLDRGYADYALFQAMIDVDSNFVARVAANAVVEVLEERELTAADQAAGVVRDQVVWLGCGTRRERLRQPVRIVEVVLDHDPTRKPSEGGHGSRAGQGGIVLRLCTDRLDLPADLIALCYCRRWQVELFFRWFKCVLGCRHLIAHNQNGITIQIYAAFIAYCLISLVSGRKPTKRTFEMMGLYLQGWANEEDVLAHLEKLKRKEEGASPKP